MTRIDPYFHRFIGKALRDVADDIQAECDRKGLTFAVLDPTSPGNIDVEPNRLNVYVDSEFRITKLRMG